MSKFMWQWHMSYYTSVIRFTDFMLTRFPPPNPFTLVIKSYVSSRVKLHWYRYQLSWRRISQYSSPSMPFICSNVWGRAMSNSCTGTTACTQTSSYYRKITSTLRCKVWRHMTLTHVPYIPQVQSLYKFEAYYDYFLELCPTYHDNELLRF